MVAATCHVKRVLRQIDPPLAPVDRHVLQKIDELKRGTNVIGKLNALAAVGVEKPQDQPPHRVGRPAAVVEELLAIAVAVNANVLCEGIEQCAQLVHRKRVLFNQRVKMQNDGWSLRRGLAKRAIKLSERIEPFTVCERSFIGQIVGESGESIERDDRRTKRCRHQN